MGFFFFSLPGSAKFKYKPRFVDETPQARKASDATTEPRTGRDAFSKTLKMRWKSAKSLKKRQQGLRTLVIIIGLLLLLLWILLR